jgi:hypothetical protein
VSAAVVFAGTLNAITPEAAVIVSVPAALVALRMVLAAL